MMHSPSQCSSNEGTITAPILQTGKKLQGLGTLTGVTKILVYDISKPVSLTITFSDSSRCANTQPIACHVLP